MDGARPGGDRAEGNATNELLAGTTTGGSPSWDTGRRFACPLTGQTVAVEVGALAVPGSCLTLAHDDPTGWTRRAWTDSFPLTWPHSGSLTPTSGAFGIGDGSTSVNLFVGAVRAGLQEPHVLLYLPEGTSASDNGAPTWLEVPTVRDPQGSGHLLFALLAGPEAPRGSASRRVRG